MPTTRRYGRPLPGELALIDRADCGPIPNTPAADRNEWEAEVETAILAVAATGLPFTTYDAARDNQLPEPPDHHHWGLLMQRLHREGHVEHAGWTTSHRPASNSSGVHVWVGTAGPVTP